MLRDLKSLNGAPIHHGRRCRCFEWNDMVSQYTVTSLRTAVPSSSEQMWSHRHSARKFSNVLSLKEWRYHLVGNALNATLHVCSPIFINFTRERIQHVSSITITISANFSSFFSRFERSHRSEGSIHFDGVTALVLKTKYVKLRAFHPANWRWSNVLGVNGISQCTKFFMAG